MNGYLLHGLAASVALALTALPALAAPGETPADAARLFLDRELLGLPGRVEVKVGEVDSRLALAPCERIEPFLPSGARLWGRGFLGLKCTAGATWRVTVPIEVKVHAVVPVAARALRAGEPVNPADAEDREIEVSAYAPGLLADLKETEGRVLARPVAPGTPFRADAFRKPQVVSAGDPVRVVLTGRGFDISLDGKALNPAAVGENLRVQLATGRTVGEILKAGRLVEIGL